MLNTLSKEYYKEIIINNYNASASDSNKLDQLEQPRRERVLEVVNALTMGCTLKRNRRFGVRYMSAESFQSIAERFDETLCAVAVETLYKHEKNVNNRFFYILGTLARFSTVEVVSNSARERKYSQIQFENVVTPIENLTEEDL